MAKAKFENDKNDNGVDDTFEEQMAEEVEEVSEEPEEESWTPYEERACRNETAHDAHQHGDRGELWCQGRRRG